MKNLFVLLLLAVASSMSAAAEKPTDVTLDQDIVLEGYIEYVSGPVGCKMPHNPAYPPAPDECVVRVGYSEIGWKLIKSEGQCYRKSTQRIAARKFKAGNEEIEGFDVLQRIEPAMCPA